jgi:hypothetical protein
MKKSSKKSKAFFLGLVSILLFAHSSAFADFTELEVTKENCPKIDGFLTRQEREALGRTFGVSMKSIEFVYADWTYARAGQQGHFVTSCFMVFDSDKGPIRCKAFRMFSNDGGKTAMSPIDPFNTGRAGLCSIP